MTERERDDGDSAPLPPYERGWRHPAELAAEERDEYQRVAAPPPLSRRSRAYVGTVAAAVCMALLAVALPKGVDESAIGGTGPRDTVTTTSSSLPIKGFAANPALVVTGSYGVTSALPVGDGHLLTALEDVTSRDDVWVTLPTGEEVGAVVVAADADTGLALLRVAPSDRDRVPRSLFRFADSRPATDVPFDPMVLDGARLIDYDGDQPATIDDGVLTSRDGPFHIVTSSRTVSGVAAVVGPDNEPIGIAVRKAQATWVVPVTELRTILTKVFGLVPPGG